MPERPATYRDIIAAEAKAARIPPELAFALVDQESSGNTGAVSEVGAQGLFQLMPETAKELGVDPTDPIQNIRGGLTYLRRQLDASKSPQGLDVAKALALYHGGPNLQQHGPKTAAYVQSILGRLQGGQGAAPAAPPSRGRLVAQPPPPLTTEETARPVPLPKLGGVGPKVPPSPRTFEQPESATDWTIRQGVNVASMVDPRTQEGRRNLAGAGGAALATGALVATAPVSIPVMGLAAGTAGVAGAFLGGELEEGGEQLIGTAPASSMNMLKAGAQQGGYELGGQAFVWPFFWLGRRIITSTVGQRAGTALMAARKATMDRLSAAFEQASAAAGDIRAAASDALRYTKRSAAEAMRSTKRDVAGGVQAATEQAESQIARAPDDVVSVARREAAGSIRGARSAARTGVEAAKTAATERTTAAAAPYESLVAQEPSAALAGAAATEIRRGPAQEALDLVGQQVEQVATDAPPVNIKALKAEAQQILDKIAKPQRSFPRELAEPLPTPPGFDSAALGKLEQEAAAGNARSAEVLASRQALLVDLEAAQKAAQEVVLKHPALGVIQRILNADDVVPFLDAHLWKSELQNALAGTYDKAVKKQVTSITQRLSGGLREALAVHEPYNTATAAYANIVPLYTKEYAAALRKNAIGDPEALIRDIRPDKPTAARMLRDLLVTQSAEGGKAAEGQAAWDAVRSAWTHANVLKGGIDKLESTLSSLPREFADIFYGDESGRAVLQNLKTIASSYKVAEQSGLFDIAQAKVAGTARVETARFAGETAVQQAQRKAAQLATQRDVEIAAAKSAGARTIEAAHQTGMSAIEAARQAASGVRRQAATDIRGARAAVKAARAPTAEEIAFADSSLTRSKMTPEQIGADIIRVIGLGPFQIWGGLSLLRLLRGPRSADLLQWAAYSPANTQMWVKLFTGASPTAFVLSDAARLTQALKTFGPSPKEAPAPSHIGARPSGSRVATAPPR
jgi:hypothetical protein